MADAFEQSPVLCATDLTKLYGTHVGCTGVSLEIYPGEVLGIVGESGSGKSTLLNMLSGRLRPTAGSVIYCDAHGMKRSLHDLSEGYRRRLLRTELGFVHQHPRDGLRMQVSAGANISERLMAAGVRRYADLRQSAVTWLKRVEIDPSRVDDRPEQYSGGMQQRLQIARNLVTSPRLHQSPGHTHPAGWYRWPRGQTEVYREVRAAPADGTADPHLPAPRRINWPAVPP